jgi:steroid delta-isomerase-like uncharacterized protein
MRRLPVLSSLRVRAVLLVLLAVLPALGLLFFTASAERQSARDEAQEDARRFAQLAAADETRLIESTRQLLVVLARFPALRGADPAACDALLADLLAQFPLYANLGSIAPDGNLLCSAAPAQRPTNLGDRSYVQRALATGEFALGEYQIGRITGRASLNAALPVLDGTGNVRSLVFAALDVGWLNDFAERADLPTDSVLTVLDRSGTVLVRDPEPEQWIGRSLVGTPVVTTILTQGSGLAETRDADGQEQLYAFVPLSSAATEPAGYLSVSIPYTVAVAPANEAFRRNLARLGLVGLVALVAAWVGADLFARKDADANRTVVCAVYEAFNSGNLDALDEAVAADFIDHDPIPGQAAGLDGLRQVVVWFREAFPDGRITTDELIAEGDRVVARVTLEGTQTGEFGGVAPSGEFVRAEGIEVFRLTGGKVTESWSLFGPPASTSAADETLAAIKGIDHGPTPR